MGFRSLSPVAKNLIISRLKIEEDNSTYTTELKENRIIYEKKIDPNFERVLREISMSGYNQPFIEDRNPNEDLLRDLKEFSKERWGNVS